MEHRSTSAARLEQQRKDGGDSPNLEPVKFFVIKHTIFIGVTKLEYSAQSIYARRF